MHVKREIKDTWDRERRFAKRLLSREKEEVRLRWNKLHPNVKHRRRNSVFVQKINEDLVTCIQRQMLQCMHDTI